MKKQFELKGTTVEEKLKSAERALGHMRRRVRKTAIGLIPPTLLAMYAQEPDEDGLILQYILPVDAMLLKAALKIGSFVKKEQIRFSCGIVGTNGSQNLRGFSTGKTSVVQGLDIKVKTGDSVVFKLDNPKILHKESGEMIWPVSGFWVTLMLVVDYMGIPQKQFMIDQLDIIANKEDENEGI